MQHYFFDFLLEDEDSTVTRRLSLILRWLGLSWLRLAGLSLTGLSLGFLSLGLLILGLLSLGLLSLGLLSLGLLSLGLRARGLSRTLRHLAWSLRRLRLLPCCVWYCGSDCLVPARDSGEKNSNQQNRNPTIPKEHSTPSWRTPLAAAIL